MNQGAEASDILAHSQKMDRTVSILLFTLAILCLGGAALLLLTEVLEYLQNGRWRIDSLLDVGYEYHLLNARWFLASDVGSFVRGLLRQIPAFAALLVIGPIAWWLSNRLGDR